MNNRRFLFLQGVRSPFFACLADALAALGAEIHKINFTVGDRLFWGKRPAFAFRGHLDALAPFLEEKLATHGYTDLVLFGDRRPVHLPAIALARRTGLRVHVFEEGYFRPHWITLERGGVNTQSMLPRDPDWYRAQGAQLPDYDDGQPVASSLKVRAWEDIAYHLANLGNPLLHPHYRTHRPRGPLVEYLGFARRFAKLPVRTRLDQRLLGRLAEGKAGFYLLPLQLSSDVQIRENSPFRDMSDVIRVVMGSFAAQAPADTTLLIKNHPLDTGLFDYSGFIRRLARKLGLSGRVHYIETGRIPFLLNHALGVVTVNSTVGTSALIHNRPTIALANPVYKLPGLTHQGPLDSFWTTLEPPDAELYRLFRNTVIHATQVNGGFYTDAEIRVAVPGCLRMLAPVSPLEALLQAGGTPKPTVGGPALDASQTPAGGSKDPAQAKPPVAHKHAPEPAQDAASLEPAAPPL